MGFLNLANGVLNLSISCGNDFIGFCFGLADDFLTLASQLLYFLLVVLDGLHHLLLLRMNRLTFSLPISFVSSNVEQVFVGIDVLTAHKFCCICNHVFRNANLTGYFYSEAAARVAYLQLE